MPKKKNIISLLFDNSELLNLIKNCIPQKKRCVHCNSKSIIKWGKYRKEDGVSVNSCEGLFSLLRSFMRVHRGIAKYNTEGYLLMFALHRRVYRMDFEDGIREAMRVLLLLLRLTNNILHIERKLILFERYCYVVWR